MCDLWRNTLDQRVPQGAIPAQIRYALERLPLARQIKLYNAGNFFDSQAIPPEDYGEIARAIAGFERVVVECHPALIGERCLRLAGLLAGRLEVAVGLETVHPQILEQLNKRMTVDSFHQAAELLARHRIALRVFLLLQPPYLNEPEGLEWTSRSLDVAFDCGATACTIIPTRGGNGAMETLAAAGNFKAPSLKALEAALEQGLGKACGRVFADLWDVERLYACDCSPARAARLAAMNRTQRIPAPIACESCPTLSA
jgi:radical SAM enzyme (TIGR01210 family)